MSYFRDYEDEGIRSDEFEGTLVHRPLDGLRAKLQTTGEEVALPYAFEATAKEDRIFIYCCSTELSASIAKRFEASVAVEILDPVRFLGRLRTALSLRKRLRPHQLVHGPVKYYEWHDPPIVDWALPERIALRKPKHFAWQNEYRFAVPEGDAFAVENVHTKLVPLGAARPPRAQELPSLLLKLGSLQKICRVCRF